MVDIYTIVLCIVLYNVLLIHLFITTHKPVAQAAHLPIWNLGLSFLLKETLICGQEELRIPVPLHRMLHLLSRSCPQKM